MLGISDTSVNARLSLPRPSFAASWRRRRERTMPEPNESRLEDGFSAALRQPPEKLRIF